MNEIKVEALWLGTIIAKQTFPIEMIDDINNAYDEKLEELTAHNDALIGKIKEENLVNELMTDNMKESFLNCFGTYLKILRRTSWACVLSNAWINEMRANEYNPAHIHFTDSSHIGLSSVLMLKRPSTYGKEYSREGNPTNGLLDFTGGQQDPLSKSQVIIDAQVGDFYVFPYTLLHGVYPFNGTDEVRRTLSYNCDLINPAIAKKQGYEKYETV